MANLSAAAAQLDTSWRATCHRWEESKTLWNDPVRLEFERDYWSPLERQVPTTQREMERLAQVLLQAQRNVK